MHCRNRPVRARSGRLAIALLLALSTAACGQPGSGLIVQTTLQANGEVISVPANLPASRTSGLTLSVDTRWANGYGYRPVEVTVSSPTASTADRLITIRLHTGYEGELKVEDDFELPLGATSAVKTIAVPTYQRDMSTCWWEVWVDGVKDEDLSLDGAYRVSTWMGGNGVASVSNLTILVTGSDQNSKKLVSTSVDIDTLTLKLGDFPRRWIDYTCLDVVSVSSTELQSLAKNNPAAFEAIKQWTRAGGQLWVSEVGAEFEELPEVSKLLQMSESIPAELAKLGTEAANEKNNGSSNLADNDRPTETGWRPIRFRDAVQGIRPQDFGDNRPPGRRRPNPQSNTALDMAFQQSETDDWNTGRRWMQDSSRWFVQQRLGLGLVWAFRGTNEIRSMKQLALSGTIFPNTNTNGNGEGNGQISRGLAAGLRTARHWEGRHGIIPDSGSADFAKVLVPGVGRAPVMEFQVLITLFVLMIGPLNYWLLKRYKRLQLLVLTVPLAAGVATVALFSYAILSDGFSTKVRVRSFTMIDQRTGEAAAWSRLSYYSGMAPGNGLTMPADVVVFPILPTWSSDAAVGSERELIWDKDQEKLTTGWLNSRTPTQYLTIRSRKTPHRLDIQPDGGKMRVTNRLGAQVESLLVIDEAGKFRGCEQLANESQVTLGEISREVAVKRIGELMRVHPAEAPEALAGSEWEYGGRRRRSMRPMPMRTRPQLVGEQWSENLASRALSDLAGLNGRPALELPPRSYVAVTTTGPEVETGISHAKEEESFHVIVGRW